MHHRWQCTAPLTNLSLAGSGILLCLPPPPAAWPSNRADHQSGCASPQACLESLSTSHNIPSDIPQTETWVATCLSSSSVQLQCFYWVLKAQEKQRTLPFPGWSRCCQQLLCTAGHLLTAKCKCLPAAISWADGFGLLEYPALPVRALPLTVSSHPWVSVFQGIIFPFTQVSTCPWVSSCVLLLLLFDSAALIAVVSLAICWADSFSELYSFLA